ncbi:hypothetical protein AVEN_54540-1 [Araneus ventricosus]|uniref:C2H2-type domain-containing protein n=1 Tax=Araneus ventricosus TaxID=182803 RepID=A0A4Y2VJR7_ARAVE|nr:hypothetical protein AVEN_54540-1 [Araneus ventricosus]
MDSTNTPLQNPSSAAGFPGWGSISTDQLDSPSENVTTDPVFSCPSCSDTFTLRSSLKKHERLKHGNKRQRRDPSPQPGPSDLQPGADTRKRQRRDPSSQPGSSTLQSDGPQRRRFRAALNTFEVEKIFSTPDVLQD